MSTRRGSGAAVVSSGKIRRSGENAQEFQVEEQYHLTARQIGMRFDAREDRNLVHEIFSLFLPSCTQADLATIPKFPSKRSQNECELRSFLVSVSGFKMAVSLCLTFASRRIFGEETA